MDVCLGVQWTVLSPRNLYRTDSATEERGLDVNDPVFGLHWTRHLGAHLSIPCDLKEPFDSKSHNSAGTQSTEEYAAAAATTARSF